MPKLLCTLCLSKEHNTANCPRLDRDGARARDLLRGIERNGERNTPIIPLTHVTPGVTVGYADVTARVTELEEENAFLRSEVARLQAALDALQPKSNAERQRVYRVKRGKA